MPQRTPFLVNRAILDQAVVFPTDLARELQCSIIVEVGGQKIGIMGYLTPETKVSALPTKLPTRTHCLNKTLRMIYR